MKRKSGSNQKYKLNEDLELLNLMIGDSKKQSILYRPGPYWDKKTKNAVNEIARCGIKNFRGSTNLIGLSYADNLLTDIRNVLNFSLPGRTIRRAMNTYPINIIFNKQVQWTEMYANNAVEYAQEILNSKDRAKNLTKKYIVPYSLLGGCLAKATVGGKELSIHYMDLLEQHDNVASRINFGVAKSVFEIGGGFGANIHLLLQNYKNIRKVVFLDIPPNLYVGTQYLKAFYGPAVSDYRDLKNAGAIRFDRNNKLQIFCIAPWQIEKFDSAVDVFINSHSFVEMPKKVVKNYVKKLLNFPQSDNCAIALTSYDGYDPGTTLNPKKLPKLFWGREFQYFEKETLLKSSRKNIYFVSPGKLVRKGCKPKY